VILVVEDDAMARTVITEIVDMAGFRAIPADTVEAGLDVLESTGVSAVLTDVRVPDRETGIAFIRTVHERWPDIPIAAITGYPYDLTQLHNERECPALIIHKPFHVSQVIEALRIVQGTGATLGVCLEL
jgi:DNA-binding NtrC family response regulator